jgi:hypothetical protein
MDKVKNLQEKTKVFRALLKKYQSTDSDAESLLRWLTSLFDQIENGNIIPPYRYEYRVSLGKDSTFYDRHKDVSSAEAEFMSALEDWISQPWYLGLKKS